MLIYFQRRQRALKPGESPYRALLETMELTNTRLTLQLINDNNKVRCLLCFLTLTVNISIVFDIFFWFSLHLLLSSSPLDSLFVPGASAARALSSPGKHNQGEDKWVEATKASLWSPRRARQGATHWAVRLSILMLTLVQLGFADLDVGVWKRLPMITVIKPGC